MLALFRRKPLLFVFLLALAVRLLNLALLGPTPEAYFAQEDSGRYWEIGRQLVQTGHLTYGHNGWAEPVTDVMPAYPLLLGGVQTLLGDAPGVVVVLQAVIDAGTCVAIAAIAAMLSPAVGLVAGLLAVFSVNLVVGSSQILTDTLFVCFTSLMLLAGARFLREPLPRRALGAGIFAGLALATRPVVGGLVVVAVPLLMAVALRHGKKPVAALAMAGLFSLAAVAPVVPTLVHNLTLFHRLSLTSQGGHHLAQWIVPMVKQRVDGTPYQATVDRVTAETTRRLAEQGIDRSQVDGYTLSGVEGQIAHEELAKLPLSGFVKAWVEGMAVNLVSPAGMLDPRVRALPKPSFYHTDGVSLWQRASAYLFDQLGLYQALLLAGLVATVPFVLLQGWGLLLLARRNPWLAVLAGGILAYYLLVNGPVASPKYRLPMEPVLIILSAVALVEAARRLRRSSPASSESAAVPGARSAHRAAPPPR